MSSCPAAMTEGGHHRIVSGGLLENSKTQCGARGQGFGDGEEKTSLHSECSNFRGLNMKVPVKICVLLREAVGNSGPARILSRTARLVLPQISFLYSVNFFSEVH